MISHTSYAHAMRAVSLMWMLCVLVKSHNPAKRKNVYKYNVLWSVWRIISPVSLFAIDVVNRVGCWCIRLTRVAEPCSVRSGVEVHSGLGVWYVEFLSTKREWGMVTNNATNRARPVCVVNYAIAGIILVVCTFLVATDTPFIVNSHDSSPW